MRRHSAIRFAPAALVSAALVACSTGTTDPSGFAADPLEAAFSTTPLGFAESENSFAGTAEGAWGPPAFVGGQFRGGDRGGPPFGMMGGGLGEDFFGGIGFGRGPGGGPPPFARGRGGPFGNGALPASCPFNAATQRTECPPETRNGLTTVRSAQYRTTAGVVQPAYDTATTNSINTQVSVRGTTTRRDGATSTVAHQSTRTVAGLATGSTRRTVEGAAAGSETTTGTRDGAAFTSVRTVGDTTRGLVIPVSATGPSYPTAGTVIRQMRVTLTTGGQTTTSERREVISYDGSATARVVITRNGETKTCTIALPRGRPNCG